MIGQKVGTYEVIAKLGEGGMGQVYRARDPQLNRDVAIKTLPESVASDGERVARFTREAQTLAALNHPNIAQIYGIERSSTGSGPTALVMELVEGEELSTLIARGALPVPEALAIARQIADALEAAHEQGIIHRDLKPANVKVRRDGTVKVLDFGLAKAVDPAGTSGASGPPSNSPTLTAHGTEMGLILGTAAYMAPEQARGKGVDRRADVWAFGVVLYEMLTGRRAFEGEDVSDILASVLRQDIDWSALPAATPAPVRRLLKRCLERDPRKRLSGIGDARLEIDELDAASTLPPTATAVAKPSLLSRLWSPDGLTIVLNTFMTGTAQDVVLVDAATRKTETVVAQSVRRDMGGRISPDGKWLLYSSDSTGSLQLWVQSFPAPRQAMQVSERGGSMGWWSPDNRQIFWASSDLRSLWRADVVAGAAFGVRHAAKIATLPAGILSVDMTPDRTRLLVITPELIGIGSVTVVQNWRRALEKR